MKNAVVICCDNKYVPKGIVALNQFNSYNPTYTKVIMGTKFDDEYKLLCVEHNILLIEVDLKDDFIKLDERAYGTQYPIECFYHFYAYKVLDEYDYIISIEPDVYTNKKIDVNFDEILYVGGSCTKGLLIRSFSSIIRDYKKIVKVYGKGNPKQQRIRGGPKIYNVSGLKKINFYEKIVEYYKTSIKINAPRCGDDSLMVFYQMLNRHI
jgi:hypothetical protein